MVERLRGWARDIKRDVHALYLSARDPRVPWYAKAVAVVVAAYALSPIDLIPDFIPVLGYLDDLILVPLGILLAVRLIPPPSSPSIERPPRRRRCRRAAAPPPSSLPSGSAWRSSPSAGPFAISRHQHKEAAMQRLAVATAAALVVIPLSR